MGRRCLLTSTAGLTLGVGTTSAIFYTRRSLFSAKLRFKIEETGRESGTPLHLVIHLVMKLFQKLVGYLVKPSRLSGVLLFQC